nr:MAG TPA: hypothetical protein [Caudoviricetes sp.]
MLPNPPQSYPTTSRPRQGAALREEQLVGATPKKMSARSADAIF